MKDTGPLCDAIFGLIAKTARGREQLLANFSEAIPSSFPTESSEWWVNGKVGLAMYRPVALSREAKKLGSIFHGAGRIYGPVTGEVKAPQVGREVLGALERFGVSAIDRFSGEFVFGFWSAITEELVLARDQMGQRCLFIREDENFFLYSSELAPLLDDPGFSCALDVESAFRYLAFGQPVSGGTMARGVTRIPAGHFVRWKMDQPLLTQRYFSPLKHDVSKLFLVETQREITDRIDAAVQIRSGGNQQAILLSGGVDSSYLAALLAEKAGAKNLDAYTIAFAGMPSIDEGAFAKLTCDRLGIRHHIVSLDTDQARVRLKCILSAAEPCSAWATITHSHLLERIAADGKTRLFSGMGADEVFGGYSAYLRFYRHFRMQQQNWPWPDQVEPVDALFWNAQECRKRLFPGVPRFFDDAALRLFLKGPLRSWNFTMQDIAFYRECRALKRNAHTFELMIAHECQHRIPELLFAGFEPLARAAGVPTVYPFLEPDLVRVAAGLGASERYEPFQGRWINKKAFRTIAASKVDPVILARRPVSYNAPFFGWLENPAFHRLVFDEIEQSKIWDLGIFNRDLPRQLRKEMAHAFSTNKLRHEKYVLQLWSLLTLAAWHNRWVRPATKARAA